MAILCKIFGHIERADEWKPAVIDGEVGRRRDIRCPRCRAETTELERQGINMGNTGWWAAV